MNRYLHGTFAPNTTPSTVGASFLTKRTFDIDTNTTVRLQVWDTAGQERFHSITKLYYRGASAVILVYSLIDENSFIEMGRWLKEVKENLGDEAIVHVVGTKADIVAQDPSKRKVPFERCMEYVAENLAGDGSTRPASAGGLEGMMQSQAGWRGRGRGGQHSRSRSRHSSDLLDGRRGTTGESEAGKRPNSGFWMNDVGWDVCHEISASSGEGVEEVFRVITRKLIERSLKKGAEGDTTPGAAGLLRPGGPDGAAGYFDAASGARNGSTGSFRLGGNGDKRRSWLLGFPTPSVGGEEPDMVGGGSEIGGRKKGGCC